ncbi:MAG: choice-of-anchor D domain-containing protein [Candidatus Acidiferrales bacterium]
MNPATNMIYVANNAGSSVTPINGNTNPPTAGTAIAAGTNPIAVAVNPVSNTIYVANNGSGNLTVINGTNNVPGTLTDPSASAPIAVALNLLTNTVYVANNGSANVTAINGTTNTIATSPAAGTNPVAIAVNPVTGMAYVANNGSANVTVISGATYTVTSISDSSFSSPNAIAVNPVTNEVYVANNDSSGSHTVTVINPANNNSVSTVTDSSAIGPTAIAVNPATNTIYVADQTSGTITAISAANSNHVTTITAPETSQPVAIAVNPVTNSIYAANSATNNVSVINAANSNHVSVIFDPSALGPSAIAVNPATGQVYVANSGSDSVSVFDGATGSYVASIGVGTYPQAIAVNPATNTVYVANADSSSVSVISGATNLVTTTVTVSNSPVALAVNSITNQIYVAGAGNETGSVTVIDGATNSTTTITSSSLLSPNAITVNPTTNKIYVANYDGNVTAIDGVTNAAFGVTDANAQQSFAVAVNPVTNDTYVVNYYSANATAIAEQQVQTNALQTTITALANNQTATETPSFSFTTTNGLTGTAADNLAYQIDSWSGAWTAALRGTSSGNSAAFSATVATPLTPGFHIVYAFATDGEDGTSASTGAQSSPLIGTITAYGFLVAPQVATAFPPALTFAPQTQNTPSAAQTAYFVNEGAASLTFSYGFTGANSSDFAEGSGDTCSSQGNTLAPGASCTVFVVFTPTTTSGEAAALVFTDNSYGVSGSIQSVALSGTGSAIPAYTLNIGASGSGAGSVASSPSGITCEPTCSATFPTGTQITLTAAPGAGSGFVQWSGACTGTAATCAFTITADATVTATFTLTGATACTGATTNWIGGTGNWSNPAMWVGGSVPASGANVCIADGTPGTSAVTLDESITVGNLYIDTGDSLTISNNTNLTVAGNISNSGQIFISAANTTAALIISGNVALTGGGTLTMSTTGAGGNAYIYENGGSTLTNVNNSIQGMGIIGYNGLTVINGAAGTMDANTPAGALYLSVAGLTNQGLMEATSSGVLQLVGGATFNNAGAHITSNGTGSMVEFLSSPIIQGGTLTTVNGGALGTLVSGNGGTLDASTHGAITLIGTYSITNNTNTYAVGTLNNTGVIQVNADNTTAALITNGNLTLTGGGTVAMATTGNGGSAYVYQNVGSTTLTNVNNTIQGTGIIGYNGLAVVNGAAGIINANLSGSALYINPTALTNQGLMEATNGGVLQLVGGAIFNNSGAHITSNGSGSMVEFLSSPTIQGGTLTTVNGGALGNLVGGNNVTLDGNTQGPITIVGTYSVTNNTDAYAVGTINNTGVIQLMAGNTTTALITNGNVTLTGGGTVTMGTTGGGGNAYMYQNVGSTVLTNVNNTIQGTGIIGYNGLAVVNEGTINANTAGATLQITTSTLTNQGLIESTGTGTLQLSTPVTNSGEIVPNGSPNAGSISNSNNLTQTSVGAVGVVIGGLTAGTQYSQLNVSGTASLSGALDVSFTNGFAPVSGNQFTVLTAGSIAGTFSSINSPALPAGINWTLTYNFSSVPQAVVLTAGTGSSTTQTLTVAELGTGTGTVTDDLQAINCSEANGITTGTCAGNYETGTLVTLTASPAAPSTFAGWGGACANSTTSPTCTVTMSAAESVTANFAAAPVSVNITFPAGNDSAQMATFNCPSNPNPTPANPCTDPNAHSLQLTIPNVSTSFTVTVTATEVPPTQADGICENGNTVLNDFDCRFATFFPGTTIANGVVTPLCYPYANGNCVHYVVYSGTQGTEPNPANYSGGVNWEITWNNDSFAPPAPYWTGSTPRLFDDPDSPPTPSAAYGTLCTQPMLIGSTPQSYSCQFEFDITTFFNPTKKVDSGIGGSTKQFNDVVVAFPPTTEIPPSAAPAITSASSTTFTAGATGFFLITETGSPAPTLTASGSLPSGVTLNTDTGILGGAPATGTGGVYPLTLTASNGVNPNATQSFTLNVNEEPVITSASATTFSLGSAGSFTVTASGFPLPTFSETGALPAGVTLNSTSGVLGGTPSTSGVYSIQIVATNSLGSSASQAFTLTVSQASGTVTLSVTELGTGAGLVTDNLQQISCSEASGVGSGPCSTSYPNPTTVTLTPIVQNESTTFAGWGGVCATLGTPTGCTVALSASASVTANFVAGPAMMNLTFPAGANSSQMATFDCPSNANPTPANPCTDPNAHALQLTIPNVTTSFTVTVLATEVPPTLADGLCENGNTVLNDFDCRFTTFFGDGTDAAGDSIVPLCYPFANGNCVHYLVYSGTPGTEPDPSLYSGGVYWEITWNNDTFAPPAPYWTGSTPQLYDDPDGPASIGAIGTSCGQPMTINGVNQSYACQFEFDITTFYDPTKPVDSGIGGSTKQFNDVVVAFPPTVAGTNPIQPPPTATTPAISGACLEGCVNTSSTISFSTGTGGSFQVVPTGYPAPTLTETGALPTGITLNGVTGILGGTPTATGTFNITLTATNSAGTATQNLAITVSALSQTITFTTNAPASAVYNSNFTVAATASSELAVVFISSGACTNVGATYTMTAGTGTCSVIANQPGNGNYSAAPTVTQTVNATPAGQTISFTTSAPATATYGSSFTVAATASSGLPVAFASSGACANSGATYMINAGSGTCTVIANQGGNGNYSAATQVTESTTATKATSTTTITSNSPNPSTVGSPVAIGVKVTGTGTPSGSVTVTATLSSTSTTCTVTLSSGTGTCSVTLSTAGTWTLTAAYGGDGNFSSSTSAGTSQIVNAASGSTLKISPPTLNFGTVYAGTTTFQTSTLTNTGSSMITFTNFNVMPISGDDSSGFLGIELCPRTLNAGRSCVVIMSFTANSDVSKTHAANLEIVDNASGSPQMVFMSATVINPQAYLSSNYLNFGNQKTGTTSAAKQVTLTNAGTTPLTLSGLTVTGNFAIASGGCTGTTSLAPGANCAINVTFTPTTRGQKTGLVKISDNARSNQQYISLAGNGN